MPSDIPADTTAALQAARRSLQNRDFDAALTILQQAVAHDQSSRELYELLGVTCTQKGMVSEGIQALTAAVTLVPTNATSRINLAVALQRASLLSEATVQLQEARKLDPENEKARQLLQSLQASAGQTPPMSPVYNPPTAYSPPADGYAPLSSQPLHPPQPQRQGQYGQSYSSGAAPSDYLPQAVSQSNERAPGQSPYRTGQNGVTPDDPGGWSPINIGPILTAPTDFFQRQRGQQGLVQPLGYTTICFFVFWALRSIAATSVIAGENGIVGPGKYVGLLLVVPIGVALNLVFEMIVSGIFHLFCSMFGGKGRYPETFRVHVYSMTPFYLIASVGSLIVWSTASKNLSVGLFALLGLTGTLWTFALMVIGFREVHRIKDGKAIGAVIMPVLIAVVILIAYSSLTA